MTNFTDCKTAQEALDRWALAVGFQEIPATLYFHKNEVVGIDFKYGEAVTKWRKPRKGE